MEKDDKRDVWLEFLAKLILFSSAVENARKLARVFKTVTERFEIIKEPSDWIVGAIGETATFTVEATGVASYQWQFFNIEYNEWRNSTNGTEATLSYVVTQSRIDNNSYRCILTGKDGTTKITKVVKMVVETF